MMKNRSLTQLEERPEGYEPIYFTAQDGLRLYARDYGRSNGWTNPNALPVVCLAGLSRNSRDFHRLALFLSRHPEAPRRVVAFDYRGRGRSEWAKRGSYTLAEESEDVLTGMAALGLKHAAFIGTSRGALIILMLAAMRPGVLAAAILNDAGPVIEGAGLARIKGYLGRMPAPRSWDHAAELLKATHGGSFPALGETDWQEMARAIFTESRKGGLAADYDPVLVRQLRDLDFNVPLPTLWPQFDGLRNIPAMTIRGENSDLLSEKTVEEMIARHPGMAIVRAEGQGHPPLLHISGIDAEIARFLTRADRC